MTDPLAPTSGAQLIKVGIDHHVADLDVRARLALDPDEARDVVQRIRADGVVDDAVLLSTCNRTELYVTSRATAEPTLVLDALVATLPGAPAADSGCYRLTANENAARHLLRVASGLESAILGETEIQGQVRNAYEWARKNGTTNPLLDRLFQTALRAGRRARAETRISDGGISHGSAAAQVVRGVFGTLQRRRVLVVGAGEIATQAATALTALGGSYLVANRSDDRGAALAAKLPEGRAVSDDVWHRHMGDAHVAVVAARTTEIGHAQIADIVAKRRDPLVLVDLTVPRTVDEGCRALAGVFLYDLDDLERLVAGALAIRREAVPAVESILHAELEGFRTWMRAQGAAPLIRSMHAWAESIRREELGHLPDDLDGETRSRIERLTKRLVQRLLGRPASRVVRGSAESEPGLPTARELRSVFGLDEGSDA